MAQFAVNARRFDPYKNFKFRVKWDGKYVAGISKMGSLKRTTEAVKHREGGDPSSSRKSPGRTEYEAITLERGVTHDPEFEAWANKVWNFGAGLGAEVALKDFRKDMIIEVYNESGQLALAYKVFRCWVSEFQALPEFDLDLDMFDIPPSAAIERQLHLEDVMVEWRFPTVRELADLARPMNGMRDVRAELLQHCVTTVRQGNRLLEFDDWPGNLATELGDVMTSADPLLDPRIGLTCAACGHAWSVIFDIATFLWREIADVARRLMSDVHRLAAAYGWNETEILELSATRRAAYLQMCGR